MTTTWTFPPYPPPPQSTTPPQPHHNAVDGKAHTDPEEIKAILAKQVTSPVQWETTMNNLVKDGIGTAYELGPGKVCAGILKRIDRGAAMVNVEV